MPLVGQVLDSGELMGTNVPSIREPFKLKYQEIVFKLDPLHPRAGVNPVSAFRALVNWVSVKLAEEEGTMPWFERKVKVGSVLKSATTVLKKSTASAFAADPAGRHDGFNVL